MRSFSAVLVFALAVNNSLAVEWADSGIKLSTFQVCKSSEILFITKIFYYIPISTMVSCFKIMRENCSSEDGRIHTDNLGKFKFKV